MDEIKSKIIFLGSRKPSDIDQKAEVLGEAKKGQRTSHIAEACSESGHYTRVPNCIYEMGLSWQEREVWMYFNRLAVWEHPFVESVHRTLGMGKAAALAAIEKLCRLNMLAVEGERKKRKFHIPHPFYWKHELPQNKYVFKSDETWVLDIGTVFSGVVVERSKRNVPNRTSANVPNRTLERSKQNVGTPLNVPNGTLDSQQSQEPQDAEPPFKTYSQDLIRLSLNPLEIERSKQNVRGVEKNARITLTELEGSMKGLYVQQTGANVLLALIKTLLRKKSAEEILRLIEAERKTQTTLYSWQHTHMDIWLSKLDALPREEMQAD